MSDIKDVAVDATKDVVETVTTTTTEAVTASTEAVANGAAAVTNGATDMAAGAANGVSTLAAKGTDALSSVFSPISGIQSSVQPAIDGFLSYAPKMVAGILILIIGLILARILEGLARRVLKAIKVDETSEKIGLKETLRSSGVNLSFTNFISKFVKYAVVILTLIAAANAVGLSDLNTVLMQLLSYIPKILIALVILAGGLVGGEFAKKIAVNATKSTELSNKEGFLVGSFLKWIVILLLAIVALDVLGIPTMILNIIIGGFTAAAALAFGLGSKKAVERFWEKLSNKSSN